MNSWVFQKWMRAFVNVQVRAADPGATNPHEHFAGTRRGSRSLNHHQFPRLHAEQRSQSLSSLLVFCLLSIKNALRVKSFFQEMALAQKDRAAAGEVRESNTVFNAPTIGGLRCCVTIRSRPTLDQSLEVLYGGGHRREVERTKVVFAEARCALQARLTEAGFRLSSASI